MEGQNIWEEKLKRQTRRCCKKEERIQKKGWNVKRQKREDQTIEKEQKKNGKESKRRKLKRRGKTKV